MSADSHSLPRQIGQERVPSMAKTRRVVLASASPRRRALVEAFGTPIQAVIPATVEPPPHVGQTAEEYVLSLSLAKATEAAAQDRDAVVLAADTTVKIDDQVLGKPSGPKEARQMLGRLRGRTHRVVTGVTALDSRSGRSYSSSKSTAVSMRSYSDHDVEVYVSSREPFDKAGGYAVQDPVFDPAEAVDGCYLNVVGLPLCEVMTLLAQLGAPVRIRPGWRPPDRCDRCPLRQMQEARP